MPAATHSTTEAAHKATSAATHAAGATTRSTTTTRATRTTTGTHTVATTTATATVTHTPTPTPEPAGGPSGAMIGGIAGGVVVLLALVGLVFYKRRQRSSVAATTSTSGKGSKDMMEIGSGAGAGAGTQNAISGPMALAPENGIAAGPTHRPEAQFREQQQFRPGMRDELFAQPGSALHTSSSNKSKGSNHNNNNGGNNYMQGSGPVSREIQNVERNNSPGVPRDQNNNNNNNNNNGGLQNGNQPGGGEEGGSGDYYDDLDFYSQEPESIGAQRSAPQPRDLQQGNLTPVPEYYLGKEDIDPRRDLRGMDNPETYIAKNRKDSDYPHDPRQPTGGAPVKAGAMTKEPLSPRSSYSSDGEAYLTIEQAQDAHNRKIQGHKESIGSVQMLIEHSSLLSPTSTSQDPMHSAAISDSTVSIMPSLPSATSPMPFIPHNNNNKSQTSSPRSNGSPPNGAGSNRPAAPPAPAPEMHDDPYAESAYSEDFYDDRSLVSGGFNRSPAGGPQYNNGPGYRQHPQTPPPLRIQQNNGPYPASPSSRGSPYSPQAMSPSYYQNQGYNNNNRGPRNQHPGSPPYNGGRPSPTSHGYSSPSPGHGPSQYPPYNGGHHGNPGPGYRPQPPQRDPSYNNNQGPYGGQY